MQSIVSPKEEHLSISCAQTSINSSLTYIIYEKHLHNTFQTVPVDIQLLGATALYLNLNWNKWILPPLVNMWAVSKFADQKDKQLKCWW